MRGRNGAELRRKEWNAPRTARSQCAVLVILHISTKLSTFLSIPALLPILNGVPFR